ncbi:YqgE/AlgH family protein [Quadrisphaera sp. DSM 44207]|uniref:YqgE/AlgH family protein n=1 Tax=Quadrisphaera sp. DSM 44207 TaxID=1881057 RepID=UPI00088E6A91|nr:putative transcriptional regulator [Quadrisphaera sp. DSM 44207]
MTGRLLVATPALRHPAFRRAVVLLLDHTREGGALGVVVNRPTAMDVEAVLPGWQPFVTVPGRLFQGGPVALDTALGLVTVPGDESDPLGVRRIVGSVGVVDLDAPPEVVTPVLAGLRIFAGYAGWSAGQLEGEIEEGSWYVVDGEAGDAFTDDPEGLWSDVLRRQPGELAWVSTFPDDPAMN